MKNILNIDNGIPTLLSNVDDGTNTLYINDELVPSSEWTGTGYYTFTSGGLTFTIQKIRDDSGNIMLQLIEQSGGTSYRLIKAVSTDDKYYSIDDPAETDLEDGDYMPFYDTSAGRKKKSLWSNIVDKLKAIFLTNFVGTTAEWNALSSEQKAQYKTMDLTDDSTPSPIDATPVQGSGNAIASGGVYSALLNKQDVLTFDNTPTANSNNPVKSGGVYAALAGKQNTLTFDNVPTSGSSNPVKSGGVYSALQNIGGVTVKTAGSGSESFISNTNKDYVISSGLPAGRYLVFISMVYESQGANRIQDMYLFTPDGSNSRYYTGAGSYIPTVSISSGFSITTANWTVTLRVKPGFTGTVYFTIRAVFVRLNG